MMCWMTSCLEVAAQEKELETAKDSVALDEVVVKAARVVNKADGKLIFPSEVQKEHSHSGFSLLGSLMLPNIRVDEANHSIAAIDQRGNVQVRINGIIANLHEVQALDVAAVTSDDEMAQMRSLNKEERFFNMDYKQAEQFMLNWKMDD